MATTDANPQASLSHKEERGRPRGFELTLPKIEDWMEGLGTRKQAFNRAEVVRPWMKQVRK